MLIRFEVSNFRSIHEPIELSMVAVDRDRAEARPAPNLGESLLPVAAIYGPNASGKSNVVAAMTWLRTAVFESVRSWDEGIPVEPFAFLDGARKPSEFTVEAVIADVRFEYVLELDDERVHYEGLFHCPERKRRRVFERDRDDLKLQRGLGNLSGTRELLTPRTLALSIARRFEEPLVSDLSNEILSGQTLGLRTGRHRPGRLDSVAAEMSATTRWLSAADDRLEALALLRMADLGIDDVLIDEEQISYSGAREIGPSTARRRVRLVHRAADQLVPLDFAARFRTPTVLSCCARSD